MKLVLLCAEVFELKRVKGEEQRRICEAEEKDTEGKHDEGGSKRRLKVFDAEEEVDVVKKKRRKKSEISSLKHYLSSMDRYGVSEAAGAALFNEQNRRMDNDKGKNITKSCIHRLKKRMRLEKVQEFQGRW